MAKSQREPQGQSVKVTRSDSPASHVFMCHNKADKEFARALAVAFAEQGIGVWFDEWNLRPGDSITAGVERGLSEVDTIVVVWSKAASKSRWVQAEIRASLQRLFSDGSVRVIPIMLDDTRLPTLLADYR